jgi:gliding motility-associated-like protein
VTEQATAGGAVVNDLCVDAIELFTGFNTPYTNDCATPDVEIPGCVDESEATVWFYYDPGIVPQDITINIISNGISSPAIAAWEECLGDNIDAVCDNSLELYCIDYPFHIEISSADVNTGDFDVEILTENSMIPPDIEVDPIGICSYELTNLLITIANGHVGDITVTPHITSSNEITGLNSHSFLNVNSDILNDELVNCGTETEIAVYEITADIPGFICPSFPILVEIPVYPKLYTFPNQFEYCPQVPITLNATDFITGGGSPFQFFEWTFNGTTIIGSNQILLNYIITESGFIRLNIIDANGCEEEVIIDILAYPEPNPFLVPDAFTACQGLPPIINITSYLQNFATIDNTVWVIKNDIEEEVFSGSSIGENMYELNTALLDPGVYSIEATITDGNGCIKEASPIEITIYPIPNGEIYEELDADCNSILKFRFYSETGEDIFSNGPDENLDGIPDQFDLDNNGVVDFIDIIWITPTMGQFPIDTLEFKPLEDGIYQVQIRSKFNCVGLISSPFVTLVSNNKPMITGQNTICEGFSVDLISSTSNYVSYVWTNDLGEVLDSLPTLTHTPTGNQYTYYLEVENQSGCIERDTFIVNVLDLPEVQLGGSTSFCPGDSTLINAGGQGDGWTYAWYNSVNDLISNDSLIYISTEDSFKVIVTTIGGCQDSTTFIVDERANLNLTIIGENICEGGTTNLDAGGGFDTYQWVNLNNDLLGNQKLLEVSEAGTYIAQVMNGMCSGTDTIEILAYLSPNVDIISSISVCNASDSSIDTLIDLFSLSINSDAGIWTALGIIPGINMTDLSEVSFAGVPMGTYQLVYNTNVAITPCLDVSDTLTVIVSDCACPFVDISIDLRLCNNESTLLLDDHLTPGSEIGMWDQIEGQENIPIGAGSEININGVLDGLYLFEYTLNESVVNCKLSDTLPILIISPPEAQLEDITVCNISSPIAPNVININDQIMSGSGIWIDPMISGLDFSDVTSLDFTGVEPDNYIFSFQTNNALAPCTDQLFEINVEVIDCACPPIFLLDPGVYCNDFANIELNDFVGISAPGQWKALNGNPALISINGTSISLTNEVGGVYYFEYTLDQSIAGCIDKDTLSIQLNESPRILEILDTTACNTDDGMMSQILDLTNLVTGDIGNWIDMNGNIIIDPTMIDFTAYDVGDVVIFTFETTEAQAPCINDSEALIVSIKDCSCDDPLFLEPPILCNEANSVLDLQDLVLNDKQGEWTIIDSPAGSSSSLIGSVFEAEDIMEGMYIVQFELQGLVNPGCQKIWQFEIDVIDKNEAVLIGEQIVCTTNFGGENTIINLFDLIADGFVNGVWLDESGDTLDSQDQIDFLNSIPGDYNYTYFVSNTAPCTDEKYDITIIADECSEELRDTIINIGNIFSPNGDGINDDIFPITNIDGLVINYFIVYDRWGNKVFHNTEGIANEPGSGWDGKSNGELVEQGVYVYVIEVQFENGKKQLFFGDVTVIR